MSGTVGVVVVLCVCVFIDLAYLKKKTACFLQNKTRKQDDDDDVVVQKKNKDVPTHASNAIFMY